MRRRFPILFVLSLWLTGMVQAQEAVQPSALEYWFDGHYDARQTVAIGSSDLSRQLDVSQLREGIHTVEMRVSDTKGRWGAPLLRYFLKNDDAIERNVLSTYTHWIDDDRANAVSGAADGELMLNIDMSQLREGIHTLQVNVCDSQGRLSPTLLRYVLVPGSDLTQRELTACRYWIDESCLMTQAAITDGLLSLDIDVSHLDKGIHTLCYQVADNTGLWSAPILRYFLMPDWPEGTDAVAAYEYWFNHGPRHHVEVAPREALSLSNVVIAVSDVVPNRIADDYVFNVAEETVTTPDDVFFGVQVLSGSGQGSLAVLSDTFPMHITVDPHFLLLNDGDSQTFAAPTAGRVQGLKTTSTAGDTLRYALSTQAVVADIYDDAGNRLTAEKSLLETGETVLTVEAATCVTYVLLRGAPDVLAELSASMQIVRLSSISSIGLEAVLRTSRHQLIVTTPQPCAITAYSASGKLMVNETVGAGRTAIALAPGVYAVKVGAERVVKVIVP